MDMRPKPLNELDLAVLDCIRDRLGNAQPPPSIRDIVQATGRTSPAPIQYSLQKMRVRGIVDWEDGKARTLQICDCVPVALEAEAIEIAEELRTAEQSLADVIRMALELLQANLEYQEAALGDVANA